MDNIIQYPWLSIKYILININLFLMIIKISIAFTFAIARVGQNDSIMQSMLFPISSYVTDRKE